MMEKGTIMKNKDIEKLIELQKIYKGLFELQKAKDTLPIDSNRIEGELKKEIDEIESIKNEIKTFKQKLYDTDIEVETLKNDISEIREKQKVIQSPKEFASLDMEEKNKKIEIEDLEKTKKEINAEITKLEESLGEKETDFDSKKNDMEDSVSIAKDKLGEIEVKLEEKKAKKDEIAKEIDPNLLRNFERIANGKNGVGIVPVEDGVCTGCYMTLPPQIVGRVRRNEDVIYCQNCARILYWNS